MASVGAGSGAVRAGSKEDGGWRGGRVHRTGGGDRGRCRGAGGRGCAGAGGAFSPATRHDEGALLLLSSFQLVKVPGVLSAPAK